MGVTAELLMLDFCLVNDL